MSQRFTLSHLIPLTSPVVLSCHFLRDRFSSVSMTESCLHFKSWQCLLHIPSIASSSTWWPGTVWGRAQIMNFLTQFSPSCCSSSLCPIIPLSTLLSDVLSSRTQALFRKQYYEILTCELPNIAYRYRWLKAVDNEWFICLQLSVSNERVVVLRKVGFNLSGNFSCEVTVEAPSFSTATVYQQMQVVCKLYRPFAIGTLFDTT